MKNRKVLFCLLLVLSLSITAGCGTNNDDPFTLTAADGTAADGSSGSSGVADGTVFDISDGIAENGFWEGVRALDYVEIFDYQSISIPNDVHQISESALKEEIEYMLAEFSTSEPVTDRAVRDGDKVNIDYVGSVDGVAFDGGSTEGAGTEVTIGVTSYIDGFLEQLIGHMPGETVNVEVTFPDAYHNASLQGKDAVFVTTINYISEMVEPELTDDFAASNLAAEYGWTTVAETNEGMRSLLQKDAVQNYINQYIANDVTVQSIPDHLVELLQRAMLTFYTESAEGYGVTLEEYLSAYEGFSGVDELIENSYETNVARVKRSLVLQAVAEDTGISVNSEDLFNYFLKYTRSGDYSSYEERYGLPYVNQSVLQEKVYNFIVENAVLA